MILKETVDERITPIRKGGVTFFPAEALAEIFDWAASKGTPVEWIEGVFYRPETDEGQLSVAYILQRAGAEDSIFRQRCLDLAALMKTEAAGNGYQAFFEIGVTAQEIQP